MEEFLAKREEWLHWLDSKHPHSISNQLVTLLVEDRTFRTVNEARKLVEDGHGGSAGFNNHVLDLLDRGFVTRQALGLRRLLDPEERKPHRQVLSLRRLLDDMKAHRHLLTRVNFVTHGGYPYDSEAGLRAYHEGLSQNDPPENSRQAAEQLGNVWRSRIRHETFDALSKTTLSTREPNDLLSEALFERIELLIKGAGVDSIGNVASKYFAHAADEFSLSTLTDEDRSFTLSKLSLAHQTLVQIVQFLCATVLNGPAQSFLPTTIYDPIKNFDKPWVAPENMATIRAFWRAVED